MFIQTEATPNPATLKFLPGQPVAKGAPREFRSEGETGQSPLARRLFGIGGVCGVFLGGDFVTVTKSAGEWQHLKPAILGVIMEHYLSGEPVILDDEPAFAWRGRVRARRRGDRLDHQGAARYPRSAGRCPGRG